MSGRKRWGCQTPPRHVHWTWAWLFLPGFLYILSAARNSLFTVFSLIKIWLESAFCKQSAKRHFRNAVCGWAGPEVILFTVGRLSTETRPWGLTPPGEDMVR